MPTSCRQQLRITHPLAFVAGAIVRHQEVGRLRHDQNVLAEIDPVFGGLGLVSARRRRFPWRWDTPISSMISLMVPTDLSDGVSAGRQEGP